MSAIMTSYVTVLSEEALQTYRTRAASLMAKYDCLEVDFN
jgi:hypothetical protein